MLRNRSRKLPTIDEERLIEELIAESFGLGPLEPYMQDPDVSDILVNGPHEVYVERFDACKRRTRSLPTTTTCCRSSSGSWPASAAASTSIRRWSMPARPTAAA
jgi:hypothetical protein